MIEAQHIPCLANILLHNDVLPFYRNLDLPFGAVLTGNGWESCGTKTILTSYTVERRDSLKAAGFAPGLVQGASGRVGDRRSKRQREIIRQQPAPPEPGKEAFLVVFQHRGPYIQRPVGQIGFRLRQISPQSSD